MMLSTLYVCRCGGTSAKYNSAHFGARRKLILADTVLALWSFGEYVAVCLACGVPLGWCVCEKER